MASDELVLAGLTELSERILEQRRTIYQLRREVDRLRRFELAVGEASVMHRRARAVLATLTWAEDLQEAKDLAARVLRGDDVHIESPPDVSGDNSSISDTEARSKET